MNRTSLLPIAGVAALTFGASIALGLPAQAKSASTASTHGSCSATSTYKINANGHQDMVVVKAKIKTDTGGEAWSYSIADNGATVVSGDATTAKNGKLRIRESIPNLDGPDTVDLTATDSVTGETCMAEVTLKG
jgi:hypothetical protein